MLISNFYCTKCGHKGIPIARKENQMREPGHLKKLYCLYCGQEVNHVECKEFSKYTHEDFLIEFNGHNFNENGERQLPWRQFLATIREENNG